MRKTISLALTLLMTMQLVGVASGEDSVASQIIAMPAGAKMELLLKNKQTMRGVRGPVSETVFTLIDALRRNTRLRSTTWPP